MIVHREGTFAHIHPYCQKTRDCFVDVLRPQHNGLGVAFDSRQIHLDSSEMCIRYRVRSLYVTDEDVLGEIIVLRKRFETLVLEVAPVELSTFPPKSTSVNDSESTLTRGLILFQIICFFVETQESTTLVSVGLEHPSGS